MKFLALILPLVPLVLAVDSNPYNTSAGALASTHPSGLDFYSNCWQLQGCDWQPAKDNFNKPIPNARQCSCNDNPDNWDDLIWFYTENAFTGDLMKGFGHYGECQDLPTSWKAKTKSVQLNTNMVCCIYTQPGCSKSGHWETRDSSIAGQADIGQFQGWFDRGVRSWKCSGKTKAGSTCDDVKIT